MRMEIPKKANKLGNKEKKKIERAWKMQFPSIVELFYLGGLCRPFFNVKNSLRG